MSNSESTPDSSTEAIEHLSFESENEHEEVDNYNNRNEFREQDCFLPVANVNRIMKEILPKNAKIAKEARDTLQECVSEFISFITSEASDKCLREKKKDY